MSANNKKVSFLEELKRRNVYRVGLAYIVLTWLVLQVIDTLGPIFDLPEFAPKLVLTILGVGFPAVMLLAWAFELTPEGIKREKDVDRSQSITSNTGQRLDRITIGVLLIAVGMLLVDKFFISDTPAPIEVVAEDAASVATDETETAPSIAVLPFVNMSDDKSSTYFSDGLADTVLHMLSQVREIRVAARTSSFQFRDQTMDIGKIGEQLNVGTVLEGSVQRAGDKIRITAQLIDVENGFHLWSGNFDRDLDDVFAIQDEIATEVVAALKVSLLGEVADSMASDQTENLDAYTEYLLAISDLNLPSSNTLRSAVTHLQAAVSYDPKYSRAWSTLGRAYLEMQGYGAMPIDEAAVAASDAASRALALTPNSSEALAVLGRSKLLENRFDEAEELLVRAIEYGPNDVAALTYYGEFLSNDGQPEEAIAVFRKATRLDPLAENAYLDLANLYIGLNRLDEGEELIARLRALNPDSPNASGFAGYIAAKRGNIAEGIQEMRLAFEQDPLDPELPFVLASMYLSIDMPDEAERWMDRTAEIDASHAVSRAAPIVMHYYKQDDLPGNARIARELLNDGVTNRRGARTFAIDALFQQAAVTDNYDPIFESLDTLYPHLFDDPPSDFDRSYMATYFTGMAYTRSGDLDRGKQYLEWLLADAEPFEVVYGVDRWSIALQLELGDRDGAIRKLDDFVARKHFSEWSHILLDRDPIYDPIRDEPTFIALMEEYDRNAAEQRQLLQTMNAD